MTQPDKNSVERLAELEADLAFMTESRNKWQDSATQRHNEKLALQARVDALEKERDRARATILEQDEELAILRPMELVVKDLAQGPQLGSVMYRWVDDLIRRAKAALPKKLRHDSPAKSLIKDEFKG